MKLKKLALLLFLFLMAAIRYAGAQTYSESDIEAAAKKYADMWTKSMTTKLNLTSEQVPKVYNANYKQLKTILKKRNKMREATSETGKVVAEQEMKPAAAEKELVMKGILTPPQFVEYKNNEAAMREAIMEKVKKGKY